MKILFTCIGKRVELVQAFRNAAENNNIELEIIGADGDFTAPAMHFCDTKIMLPKIKGDEYIPLLVDYCENNKIDALIPTIDSDLLILAQNKDRFTNTKVIISSVESIRKCRDKRLTAEFFYELGLNCPKTVDDFAGYDCGYPAFIKPRDGSSSINSYKINNSEELREFSKIVPDYIIQQYIDGTEYTVDAFCDFEGNPIFITPRIRLAVRSGEVSKTKIHNDVQIIEEAKKIINALKPVGAITIQLIKDKAGDDYFIEINPRFGGGAPLSIKAGADSCGALLGLLTGKKVEQMIGCAEEGATYSRFDQSIRVDK